MKNLFLTHLDKINFVLILVLFGFHFINPSTLNNRQNTTSQSQYGAPEPQVQNIQTITMAHLVRKGFRPSFTITEVNGRKFENKDEALSTAMTHNLNQSALSLTYIDDQKNRKTLKISNGDLK